MISLPSAPLDAFVAVARARNFSRAAREVHITQSALSQRIQSLERILGTTLIVRGIREARLTDAGERLLRFCRAKDDLETEVLDDLNAAGREGLGGRLRLAGYSTVVQSVIAPALAPLLRRHARVQFEFGVRQMRELPAMLLNGEADFIVLDRTFERAGVEARLVGRETYVMIESRRFVSRTETFLDHDSEDATTEMFLRRQSRRPAAFARSFAGDIHGVMSGVALGLGKAVVPRHLIRKGAPVKIEPGFKPWETPVVLHFLRQPYYSKLHAETVRLLSEKCRGFL